MNSIFKQYQQRLSNEGWLKSFLWGLLVGCISLFVSAAIIWFIGWETKWWIPTLICIGVLLVTTGAATTIFYFTIFRPTDKDVARRVDDLGLYERILTMKQLEGDDSYIAKKQKEDALNALKTVNPKLIKFVVSTSLIVATAIVGALGMGMTTITALSAEGIVEGGGSIVEELVTPEPVSYEVVYEVFEGEGMIEGEFFQVVEAGKNATPVLAVPDDGWMFVMWSDGLEDPYREDLAIVQNMEILALFQEAEEMPQEGEGEGEDGAPSQSEADQGEGQPSEGEGSPSSGSAGQEGTPSGGSESNSDGPGGGAYEDSNQVIDGETYYGGSTYDNAYGDAMDEVSDNGEISDGEGDIIEDYFGTIEK
jgi:hypothetical protein